MEIKVLGRVSRLWQYQEKEKIMWFETLLEIE